MAESTEEFYTRFKIELEKGEEFPSNYTYKFILPTDNKKIVALQQVFDHARPQISSKPSKNNKYTSFTIVVYVLDADMVIGYYKEAAEIEGIISL